MYALIVQAAEITPQIQPPTAGGPAWQYLAYTAMAGLVTILGVLVKGGLLRPASPPAPPPAPIPWETILHRLGEVERKQEEHHKEMVARSHKLGDQLHSVVLALAHNGISVDRPERGE